MVESNKLYDFNNAGKQRSFEPIPNGTICNVQLTLRMHLDTPDGWLRRSKDGGSLALDAEFEVLDGDFAGRKFWQLFTISGTTTGHGEAAEISRCTLRAIMESAKGIRPSDEGETAQKARLISDWGDFHGLCFMVRVGVRPAQNNFPAKNTLDMVITPDHPSWRQVEQRPVPKSEPKAATGNGASATPATTATTATSAPAASASAGAVPSRPNWAK